MAPSRKEKAYLRALSATRLNLLLEFNIVGFKQRFNSVHQMFEIAKINLAKIVIGNSVIGYQPQCLLSALSPHLPRPQIRWRVRYDRGLSGCIGNADFVVYAGFTCSVLSCLLCYLLFNLGSV